MTKEKEKNKKRCCSKRKIRFIRFLAKLHDIPKMFIGVPTKSKRKAMLEHKKVDRKLARNQKELEETTATFKQNAKTFSGT